MKKAERSVEINKNGKTVRFEIVAERGILDWADKAEGFSGFYKTYERDEVVVFVDGKQFEKGSFQDYRGVNIQGISLPQGAVAKIGSKMLLSPEMAEMIGNLVAEARAEAETDEEYRTLKAKNEAKKTEAKAKEAARIVAAFEAGKCLKSYAEAKRYNDIHNEGGDGYVPEVITPEDYQTAKALVENNKKEESKMEKYEVPVFESNSCSKADFYADPETFENKNNENAEPTCRLLDGTDDFWAAEEWAEPVVAPDGRAATKYYLFAAEEITDDDGNGLLADEYPFDAAHVSRIEIQDEEE